MNSFSLVIWCIISTHEGIDEMMETSGKENFEAKSIMILGGSRIGKHVALYMQKSCEVKLIDSDIINVRTWPRSFTKRSLLTEMVVMSTCLNRRV